MLMALHNFRAVVGTCSDALIPVEDITAILSSNLTDQGCGALCLPQNNSCSDCELLDVGGQIFCYDVQEVANDPSLTNETCCRPVTNIDISPDPFCGYSQNITINLANGTQSTTRNISCHSPTPAPTPSPVSGGTHAYVFNFLSILFPLIVASTV